MKIMLIALLFSGLANAQQTMKFKGSSSKTNSPAAGVISTVKASPRTLKNDALSTANYFPAKGVKAITLTPKYETGTGSYDFRTFKGSAETSGLISKISYIARASENTSIEGYSDFGTQNVSVRETNKVTRETSKADTRQSGIGDLHLKAVRPVARGAGTIFFSADFGLNLSTGEQGSARSDGNRSSGGISLTPALSYEQQYGARVVGARGSLALLAERSFETRVGNRTSKYQVTGGEIVSLGGFTEWFGRNMTGGFSADLRLINSSTRQASGQQSVEFDPTQNLLLSLYGEAALRPTVSLIPALTFETVLNRGSSNIGAYDNLGLALGAKIAL